VIALTKMNDDLQLGVQQLAAAYAGGTLTPSTLVELIFERIAARGDDGVWITLTKREDALRRARGLEALSPADRSRLPLWGIPFSVKDCIDVAGLPTTSACPAFAYVPERSSTAVDRLLDRGAILIGKTNMDQFATGLVGVRSPYGIARNPFDAAYIPGGSSSGAAVSVAAGLVTFALGTDTGGSGRVPAAFNNLVGLKPTLGLVSGVGTVPACRSIETVSIFAQSVPDAQAVFEIITQFDATDPFARNATPNRKPAAQPEFRYGVPATRFLDFFGNADAAALFGKATVTLSGLGGSLVEIDYTPFLEINELLFHGPWLAERYGALRHFIDTNPAALHPLTREILLRGRRFSGADVFAAQHDLLALKRKVDAIWRDIDVFVVPTTGTIYRLSEVEADPLRLNERLGTYTNFVNLADLAAMAVPNGFLPNGLPQGVTLIGPAFSDDWLAMLAAAFRARSSNRTLLRGAQVD
jgi:allophanate hydrolase